MKVLEQQGITTIASLRKELKNSNLLDALSKTTGIDTQYLILFRREIEGYFPKPSALKAFDWLPGGEIAKLEGKGIRHTAALYEEASSIESRAELVKSTGVDVAVLEALVRLADLTRVQWCQPRNEVGSFGILMIGFRQRLYWTDDHVSSICPEKNHAFLPIARSKPDCIRCD